MTNILRDIREDAGRGRIYLPAEDLARFGVTAEELMRGRPQRAHAEADALRGGPRAALLRGIGAAGGMVHKRSRPSLRALIGIYSRLLERIEESNYDVFSRRISLSTLDKAGIVLRSMLRTGTATTSP